MPSTKKIEEAFKQALNDKLFPGASVLVGNSKKIFYKECFGNAEIIPVMRKVYQKTWFDVASLTKALATTTLAMLFYQEGKLKLEDPISKYFTRWKKETYAYVTIKHLLQHTSGLPSYEAYYESLFPIYFEDQNLEEVRKILLSKILSARLEWEPGKVKLYSDLGFILLGFILEKIGGAPLDELFAKKVAKPLGLDQSFFIRLSKKSKKILRTDYASTRKCILRRKVLAAEVDDEHAWLLDGVAGHAGLFSTLKDLTTYCQEILQVDAGKSEWMSQKTFRTFVNPRPSLGWDNPAAEFSQAGDFFSKDSIGHLGFTGTSIWIDLHRAFFVVLLTNRVHPIAHHEGIKSFRPLIHNLLINTFKLNK